MQSGKNIYSVSHLTREIKRLLETSYPVVLVEGEISGLSRPASGHQYFNIKDENAQVSCAFFKNASRLSPVRLADGMQVLLTAKVSLYERRGDFQLIVQSVVESGEGLLRKKFEHLKKRLELEGLFNSARKRALPRYPRHVGIITSTTGAALHDMLITFRRRYPAVPVLIYPSQVQGELAAASLVNALKTANVHQRCDVLVVARGGGSLEDLWPFNEEIVARAIYESEIPVVSAVGHETDISISDLVADARAATPTAAAEMLSPDREQLSRHLVILKSRLTRLAQQKIEVSNQRLDLAYAKIIGARHELERQKSRYAIIEQSFVHLARSMIMAKLHGLSSLSSRLHTPDRILEDQRQSCLDLFSRMDRIQAQKLSSALFSYRMLLQRFSYQQPGRQLQQKRESLAATGKRLLKTYPEQVKHRRLAFESKIQALNTLSPLMTLGRGYAALQDGNGEIISSVDQVQVGESIKTMLRDGTLQCMIENISRKQDAK